MKNKLVTVLLVIVIILTLAVGGIVGFLWYRDNHIFVEGKAYSIHAVTLDLRQEDISADHYDQVHAQLPQCQIVWNVPFQNGKVSSDSESISVSTLTQEDVDILSKYFPNLKTLDASACHDYAQLEAFQSQNPDCAVTYTVDLGGKAFPPDTTELALENGDYTLDALMENLVYLPQVKSINLKMPELSLEQVEQLKAAYEAIDITCTVELMGKEYDTQTTQLDLSSLTSDGIAEVAEKLAMLPNLESVELTDAEGVSQLTKEDVKTLMDTAPEVKFHYSFDFFGQTISTTDEEVHIKNTKIGDEGEQEVRLALDLMQNCSRFVLENCQMSNDVLAKIRDDYRDKTKVVWRVYFGEGGSSLTDAQVIRSVYGLVDDNCHDLIYCEDVQFMDIGHNEFLDAVPFVAGMPNLEYIIVSGAPIKDLTPFENCKKLKFLEIAFCEYIEDLSPLANCESLEMLNISNTHALDLSPLDDLPLTHLCARLNPAGGSRIPKEEQDRFVQQHPDCWSSFTGSQPYGVGWRYDTDEITPLPAYELIAEAFRYPNAPNNVGWYLETETES